MFLVFTRALDDRLARVARAIDKDVAEATDKRTGFIVLLADNNPDNQAKVAAFAKQHQIALPMTIATEGSKGPQAYKLNPEVPITALLYKGKKVGANLALAGTAPADEAAQSKEAAGVVAAAEQAFK